MNIGGLYCYPRATKDLWDSIDQTGFIMNHKVQAGDPFVILGESIFSENKDRAHLKILTAQGIIGWIAYIDKPHLKEVIP
jgi:hypothetical protein